MDLTSINRNGYYFIEMLSDIGGIQSILLATFTVFLSIVNHNYFDSYMAQRLYKLEKEKLISEEDEPELFKPSKIGNTKEFFIDAIPQKLVCCRKSRHQKGLDKARQALEKEVDIFTMIKSRRYFHMALRYLLPKQVRLDLKRVSHYVVIDPDEVEE